MLKKSSCEVLHKGFQTGQYKNINQKSSIVSGPFRGEDSSWSSEHLRVLTRATSQSFEASNNTSCFGIGLVRAGLHRFSLLLDEDVSNAVNLCELLTVQRGEELPLTSHGRNKPFCQDDGRQVGHVTAREGTMALTLNANLNDLCNKR